MSSTEAPFLAIWEAMNLIQEAQECSDVADRPEILAKAEMVLWNVLKELVQNANKRENTSSFRELSSQNGDPLGLPGFQQQPDLDGRYCGPEPLTPADKRRECERDSLHKAFPKVDIDGQDRS